MKEVKMISVNGEIYCFVDRKIQYFKDVGSSNSHQVDQCNVSQIPASLFCRYQTESKPHIGSKGTTNNNSNSGEKTNKERIKFVQLL